MRLIENPISPGSSKLEIFSRQAPAAAELCVVTSMMSPFIEGPFIDLTSATVTKTVEPNEVSLLSRVPYAGIAPLDIIDPPYWVSSKEAIWSAKPERG